MSKFTDESIMPFGAHKGKKMANIPADYLVYIYDNFSFSYYPEVKKYIKDNLDVLKSEIDLKNKSK